MIYFGRELQGHVHELFHDSLVRFGVLALGRKEAIRFTPLEERYERARRAEKLYRRRSMSGASSWSIGASWGGLGALRTRARRAAGRLPGADRRRPAPRRRTPTSALAALLARHSALPVREADDKEPLEPGHVYVAPADYHLLVERGALRALASTPPCSFSRPSIDVLVRDRRRRLRRRRGRACCSPAPTPTAPRAWRAIRGRGGIAIVAGPRDRRAPRDAAGGDRRGAGRRGRWPLDEIAPLLVELRALAA